MISRPFLAGAAALALVALQAAPVRAADPTYPIASHIGLVAPGAMKPSPNFRGFIDPAIGASILILELPAKAYDNIEKEMATEALKKQGMTEEKREAVTLPSGKGILVVGEQTIDNKSMRKWLLLASLGEIGALVSVQIPDDAKAKYPDADVRAALLSLAARKSVPIDEQLALMPITFSDLAGLRPFRVVGSNSVFMTDGPKDTMDAVEQPILVVSIAPGGPQEPSDRLNFARTLFTGLAEFKDVHILTTDMLRIDSQQIAELQAEAKDVKTDTPMRLVQWVRFGGNAFVRFVGVARADVWLQAFPKFHTVRESVKPRS